MIGSANAEQPIHRRIILGEGDEVLAVLPTARSSS